MPMAAAPKALPLAISGDINDVPSIRIEPIVSPDLQRTMRRLAAKEFEVLCVTSPNGAAQLFAGLDREGLDARALGGVTVAAIGPGTAAALRAGGVIADVVPERSIAESLAADLISAGVRGKHVLVARAPAPLTGPLRSLNAVTESQTQEALTPVEIDPEGAAVEETSARIDHQRRVRVREQERVAVADDVDREPRTLGAGGNRQRHTRRVAGA